MENLCVSSLPLPSPLGPSADERRGEQIWATAVKASLRSAVLMWPGPPVMQDGTKPTYWYPFVDRYHYRKKVRKVAGWLGAFELVSLHLTRVVAAEEERANGVSAQTWTTLTAHT